MTNLHARLQAANPVPPTFAHLHVDAGTLWQRIGGDDVGESELPIENVPRRTRRRTLASIVKEASRAGLTIAQVEFDADGRISGIVTGKADEKPDANDEWDGVLLQ